MKTLTPLTLSKSLTYKPSHHHHHQSLTHITNLINQTIQTKFTNHLTQLHTQIIINNYLTSPSIFHNLLNLYTICNLFNRTLILFQTTHDISLKNTFTWTSMITKLSHSNQPLKGLAFFNEMREVGVLPNHYTFSSVLSCCGEIDVGFNDQEFHCLVLKYGFVGYLFVGSALVDMYAKRGDMVGSRKVFDEMPERNLVSWNSMIVGFSRNKEWDMALLLFKRVLKEEFVRADEVSFSSAFSACASMGTLECGKQVHGVGVKYGIVGLDYVRNSLMDMYCKCKGFDDAVLLFDGVAKRDVVAWNVMIMGCASNGEFKDACSYFWTMKREGVVPDEASYSSALYASANLAEFNQGILIHGQIIKTGYQKYNLISSSLITMYSKCGSMDDAHYVFEEIKTPNIVCWSAAIAGCQQHGYADKAISLFEEMLQGGIKPECITFVSVLSACSHAGRVEEGYHYLNSMSDVHGLIPSHEHYACMVDLLCRAKRLDEAKKFVESMPIKPNASVWGALLGACTTYNSLELGIEAAEKLFQLEPNNPGNYILLSNLYTRNGMPNKADHIRRLMGIRRVKKEPGCSWLEIKNSTFVFTAHDRSHPRTPEIYETLTKLEESVKAKGYKPETQYAVNSTEEYKEQSLWYHSEKLALAFALLELPNGAPIRIKKNLRTCGDCHTVMKFASEIFYREIIIRDVNRFHRFRDGVCSCGDFW